jgi:hypothetical protein
MSSCIIIVTENYNIDYATVYPVFDYTVTNHWTVKLAVWMMSTECGKILIAVLPCILISSKLFCQQMHSLLKHKMLQLTLKISLYMVPTCFGPLGPSSGSIRRNLAKVTVFVEIISKNTSLKLSLCYSSMCFSLYSTQYTHCCTDWSTYCHSTATILTIHFYF